MWLDILLKIIMAILQELMKKKSLTNTEKKKLGQAINKFEEIKTRSRVLGVNPNEY